jgi:hypothetical protein
MCLFPPWVCRSVLNPFSDSPTVTWRFVSYGFIGNPPRSAEFIDLSRLVVLWVIVVAITGSLIFFLKDNGIISDFLTTLKDKKETNQPMSNNNK